VKGQTTVNCKDQANGDGQEGEKERVALYSSFMVVV
jgi:hypothetical protein